MRNVFGFGRCAFRRQCRRWPSLKFCFPRHKQSFPHDKELNMKSVLISAMVAAGVMASAPAFANKDLATKSGCMACHAVDKKLVGPAYQEVAKKYKAGDEAKLADKVRKGGKGN